MRVQLHSFKCRYPISPIPFIEEAILSLFCIPSALVEEQLTEYTCIYFSIQDLKNILDSSLLVHINKTMFLMLLLYSTTY